MTKIEVECCNCKNLFLRSKSFYNHSLKNNKKMFCNKQCYDQFQIKAKFDRIECNCNQCNKKFYKQKFQFKKSFKHFCSRQCANKFRTNKDKDIYCTRCDKFLYTKTKNIKHNLKICKSCNKNTVDWSKIKVGEFKLKFKNVYQYHSRIRALARSSYLKSNKPKKCSKCGYNKHYEVCHIKYVSSFDDNCFVSNINDESNLLALCPNCHWEFDNIKSI